ncbi:unnamed protein product [Dovyalis caffra]|uniref:Basic blue protein n=1 Tax=Dovyalis caffra TaxID=77055 RepID=A0AAV1S5X2_9ROSI|nr:unnamed protein product [Dovyalis caffra]
MSMVLMAARTATSILCLNPKHSALGSNSKSKANIKHSGYPTVRMQRKTTTRIQRLIEDEGIVLMPGCYDALSAAIVEKTGFSAGFVSGYAVSASLLGKPDIGLLTPPEMSATARTVCAAAPLIPIIADADTGGGNVLNIQRTVKDLIAAGAAGCFLEDQAWPKKCGRICITVLFMFNLIVLEMECGHMHGKQVIPAEEHAAKIASARDAIGDSDFFLVARSDARATSAKTGLSEAISRANLYMEAGADACFVEAPRDDDELKEIGRRTKGYRVCNMIEGGVTPLHTPEELKAMGFHLIVHSLTSVYASARALVDVLKTLKANGTTRDNLQKLATFEEFNQLINLESWFELEARLCREKELVHFPKLKSSVPESSENNLGFMEKIREFRGSAGLAMIISKVVLLCLIVLAGHVQAATYTVGGSGGWTFNVDSWPKGKSFKVGDTIVFNYDRTIHNVVAVNSGGYTGCTTLAGAKVHKSGQDQIKLVKGQNFFICNVAGHCESGMKIAINAA